jgi:two-component system, NtrC family, nitrogen regulation sensor histidine kinase NtrY
MTFRTKFIIFLIFLHLVEFALAGIILHSSKYWFIASESVILISLIASVYFFRAFSKPLQLLNSGIESLRDKDFSMRLVKVGQPELDSLIEVYNQMIDQLRNERTMQQEQHFFLEKLVQASPAGIIIIDPDEKVKMINPIAETFTGLCWEVIRNKRLPEITNNFYASEIRKLPLNETTTVSESGLQKFRIHKSSFVNQGFRNHFVVIEELTREYYQIERSAYEKVIRTISHEFNNSIGPINSILDSLNKHLLKVNAEENSDFEDAIRIAIDRNNALNEFIKRYARLFKLPQPIKEECNIYELLERIEKVFHFKLKQRNINLSIYSPETPLIRPLDVNQFELVFTNILQNAMDAIGADGGIEIETRLSPAKVLVRNNGEPISPEIQQQLFTPFFTTKKSGQGIGLTLIREILQNHNCTFSLQSLANGITEFTINFG